MKKRKAKKSKNKFPIAIIGAIIIGIIVFYFYSADQAKIRGFAFGNEIQTLQEEIQDEQGKFISSIAKWNEKTISDDEMIRIGEKHLETFNGLLDKYDELHPPDAFIKSVKLLRIRQKFVDLPLETRFKHCKKRFKMNKENLFQVLQNGMKKQSQMTR